MASTSPVKYLNIADIKDHWLKVIAPNYFDFDNYNNYQVGIFGYVNEVMGEAVEDAFSAVSTARREFYPITAEYMSSLYKMATLQQIDIPLTTPAHCKCALILNQQEVIDNSIFENGIYTCTLDSCMKIMCDNLQFMMDYPVKIISKKTTKGWTHTVHYDITIDNSLDVTHTSRYIPVRIMKDSGTNYLVLLLDCIRQVVMTKVSNVIIKDSVLETTSVEVDFDGNLANFEVFYIANQAAPRVQLTKVLMNGSIPPGPFCYYELVSQNKIRLTFPSSTSFMPEFNSEIETYVYTSSGAEGNFDQFNGNLICTSDSEEYPYNSTMFMLGIVSGSSTGGMDQMIDEQFRTKVIRAYATNNTIVTASDLQIYFDEVSEGVSNMKVLFRKKRDDPLYRLWGAYILMKDREDNIVPSNTLDIYFAKSDVMTVDAIDNRVMVKPGTKFVYESASSTTNFKTKFASEYDIKYPEPNAKQFIFTNPFLIGINLQPNTVGFYLNSIDEVKSLEYKYVNDDTPTQFIASDITIYRNAMSGANYYKITVKINAATSGFDITQLGLENPFTTEDEEGGKVNTQNGIRAKMRGKVLSTEYVSEEMVYIEETSGKKMITPVRYGYLKTIIEYENGTQEVIISSNTTADIETIKTGYKMNFNPGEEFQIDDVLATKLATDLRKLKIVGDFGNELYNAGMYIPFNLEEIDGENMLFVAYLATNDFIDSDGKILISAGIVNYQGIPDLQIPIQMNDVSFTMHALYKNDDINFTNKYANYTLLSGYTLTNTYITPEDDPIALIEPFRYIRSLIDFYELGVTPPTIEAPPLLINRDELDVRMYKTNEIGTYQTEYTTVFSGLNIKSGIVHDGEYSGLNDKNIDNIADGIVILPMIVGRDYEITEINRTFENVMGEPDSDVPEVYTRRRFVHAIEDGYKYPFIFDINPVTITCRDVTADLPEEDRHVDVFKFNMNFVFESGYGRYIPIKEIDERDYGIYITECPMLSYDWAIKDENYRDFVKRIRQAHSKLDGAYRNLENNFSIDMKFYNTYGKSRFYKVGLDDIYANLDDVSCRFRFGIRTTTLTNKEEFIDNVRKFIKNYVEDLDNVTNVAQDIFILNLTAAIRANFTEIDYIVYLGFNEFNHKAQKIIGPDDQEYQERYIPEFINIRIAYNSDGIPYPDIEINLLEE